MDAKNILVAGGAGYIGSALVPALAARGAEVTVIDLLWFGNHLPPGTRVLRRDIYELSVEDLRGYDTVIFLSGLSNDPMSDFSPALNFRANAAGPAFLAYIAKAARVRRFIHGGTASVYGLSDGSLLTEDSPTKTTAAYGLSKLQGEFGCLNLRDDNFSVISLRKGTVCGHSPRMRFDLVVNMMFRDAMTMDSVTVNNPFTLRPIVDIADAVRAYIAAVDAPAATHGIYNIVSENTTIGGIADRVVRCIDDVTVTTKYQREVRSYQISGTKAERDLGFQPYGTIESIVAGMLGAHETYGGYRDPNYQNIEVLERLRGGVGLA